MCDLQLHSVEGHTLHETKVDGYLVVASAYCHETNERYYQICFPFQTNKLANDQGVKAVLKHLVSLSNALRV